MKRLVPLLLLAACSPGRGYIHADRLTYDVVAPAFAAYVGSDQSLDQGQRDRRLETLRSWEARIQQAEKGEGE